MDGKKHWADIVKTAHEDGEEADHRLLRYCMEAIRLNGMLHSTTPQN